MKRFSILLFVLLSASQIFAQSENEEEPYYQVQYHQFKGSIGNIPITMNLKTAFDMRFNVVEYSGTYMYDSQKIPIQLSGVFRANGQGGMNPDTEVYITESYQGKTTGYFVSKDFKNVFEAQKIQGRWLNANNKPVYNFVLIRQYKPSVFD